MLKSASLRRNDGAVAEVVRDALERGLKVFAVIPAKAGIQRLQLVMKTAQDCVSTLKSLEIPAFAGMTMRWFGFVLFRDALERGLKVFSTIPAKADPATSARNENGAELCAHAQVTGFPLSRE